MASSDPAPRRGIVIEVSPGELLDKIAILEIKSERIRDPQKLGHVRHELALLRAVCAREIAPDAEIERLSGELKTVNGVLWDIEDEIRACEARKDFGAQFIDLARAVYRTNDRRAALKKEIDMRLGSAIVEQKSYADY